MSNPHTIASSLSYDEHNAWLDWLIYHEGIEPGLANSLTLADDSDPEAFYQRALSLHDEWVYWAAMPMEVEP